VNPTFEVRVTYIATDRVGILNVGAVAVVTPKAIESVINITNFPYTNVANSVRLNIGVATQASAVQATAQFTHLAGGNGNAATYFTLNKQVLAGGVLHPAQISAFVDVAQTADFGNNDVVGQVNVKYANAASFKIVSVTFPAGAASIIYDPAVGAGSTPPDVAAYNNGASSIAFSFVLLALIALLF